MRVMWLFIPSIRAAGNRNGIFSGTLQGKSIRLKVDSVPSPYLP